MALELRNRLMGVAIAACFLWSCSSESNDAPAIETQVTDSLFSEEGKDFRMVSFGDYRENIPLGDGPGIIENEANRLVEQIVFENEDSTTAEIFYLFADNRLSEAEINIITRSDSVLALITKQIEKVLQKRFGKSYREGGFVYWSGKSAGKYSLEIYMGNGTGAFKYPTLQLIFRAELVETTKMAMTGR